MSEPGSVPNNTRLNEVKTGICNIWKDARKKVKANPASKFHFSVVTFCSQANVCIEPFCISNDALLKQNIRKIKNLAAGGETNIWEGINRSTRVLQEMNTSNHAKGTKALILLTDGDNIYFRVSQLTHLQQWLENHQCNLFVIGIGKQHNKQALQQIAENCSKGVYIDTTQQQNTIESAMSRAYQATIVPFRNLTLSCNCPMANWDVAGCTPHNQQNVTQYKLGSLESDQQLVVRIRLAVEKTSCAINMNEFFFTLTHIDSATGTTQSVEVPWKTHSNLDDKLIRRVERAYRNSKAPVASKAR